MLQYIFFAYENSAAAFKTRHPKPVKNVKYVTSLYLIKKTIDPGKVSFLLRLSLDNIMFLTYMKFERNLLLGKNHETVAYAFNLFYAIMFGNLCFMHSEQ